MTDSPASLDALAYDISDHKTPDSIPGTSARLPRQHDDAPLDGGARIGRYVVLYRHGRGGMGQIYAAFDPELDRRVAIKLLRRGRKGRRDPHARMVREAQALARLSHPNVVAIHDVGVHDGRVFVAMDFVDGLTLRRWIAAEARPLAALLRVFVQAGRGLAAAHKAGLVHRDFKPENVIVDADGRAQVLDFGLARASTSAAVSGSRRASPESGDGEPGHVPASSASMSMPLTRDGALVGTPAYMAPEQHLRHPTHERTDQFAYCVTLYEAVYRESPFAGDDDKALRGNVLAGTIKAAPRASDVPSWLRALLVRGLSVEPGDRWPTMDALLVELQRDRRAPRRRWLGRTAGVAVLGAVAAASVAVSDRDDRCSDADAPLRSVWNAARRETVQRAFMGVDKPYAAAAWRNAAVVLDAHAHAWSTAQREACAASWGAQPQTQPTLVLRFSCLQRRLDELDGLIDVFSAADDQVVARAVQATHDLTPVDECADVAAATAPGSDALVPEDPRDRARAEELRARLSEARTAERAGHYAAGLEVAGAVALDAQTLAFRPVQAEALVTVGRLQVRDGKTLEAKQTLDEAVFAAEAGGHVEAAAQAWVLLLEVASLHPNLHAPAAQWERHATALVEQLGVDSLLDAQLQRATGNLRRAQAQHADAVRHLQRGATILEARVGETPALGETLTCLGNAYAALGRLEEARTHHERALAILRRRLGEDHPDVASAMTGLAMTLDELGLPQDAFPLYARAVEIFSHALGPTHPSVATALNNYAGVLYVQGDHAAALERYERAAAIWEGLYGPDHPDVALTLGNIGLTLEGLGRWPAALEHHQRALEIRERAWGPEHPDVAISLLNLGDLHWAQGRFDAALEHHRRAVEVIGKTLGPDHLRLAAPLEGMAADLVSLGQSEPAQQQYRRALAIRESAMGPDHVAVARILMALGVVQLDGGDAKRALGSLRRAAQIHDTHAHASREAAAVRFALAKAMAATGDPARARRIARQAQAEYRDVDPLGREVDAVDAWLLAHAP